MSFLISANRLFTLTQSKCLRKLILGNFSVQVLTSPTTVPYSCNVSSEAVQVALDAAESTNDHFVYWNTDRERESFIDRLKGPEASGVVVHSKPTVHAELAMVMAMANGEIAHAIPYIGLSKHSCIMCSQYICNFNKVMGQNIAIRGSHGKVYPGWSWPVSLAHDEELREAFLKSIRQHLFSNFKDHAETHNVGSEIPRWESIPTRDDSCFTCDELGSSPKPKPARDREKGHVTK
jgi:hypothetical protein